MNARTPDGKVSAAVVEEILVRVQAGELIEFDLTLPDALVVLAALQIEIRCGRFTHDAVMLARGIAGRLEQQLSTTPACAEHCERGWYRPFKRVAYAATK